MNIFFFFFSVGLLAGEVEKKRRVEDSPKLMAEKFSLSFSSRFMAPATTNVAMLEEKMEWGSGFSREVRFWS